MSMSTQHGGGNRKPSTRPVAGAKPKQGEDEEIGDVVDAVDAGTDPDAAAASDDTDSGSTSSDASDKARPKASPRKSAPARKTTAAKTTGAKATAVKRPTGGRPAIKKVAPVKVGKERNWGPIALFTAVGVLAAGIIGFMGYSVWKNGLTYEERAGRIEGVVNYRKTNKAMTDQRTHVTGKQTYPMTPPVAGNHNQNWQRCLGDVYPEPIANEHALHSMEHGAVWITYDPAKIDAAGVEKLAKRVRGQDYTLMSPYPEQGSPISLQAWGFQLKVTSPDDERIGQFITALRQNASLEPGTPCSSGSFITETGTTPRDLEIQQQQQGG